MQLKLVAAAIVLTAGAIAGQQASYTYFGQGCGVGPPPHFQALGVPRIGNAFVIETVASCHGACSDSGFEAWVLTGASNTQFGGAPLPFDLSVFSYATPHLYVSFCGSLLVSVEAMHWTPSANSTGYAHVSFNLPNSASLVGTSFYQQVLVQFSGCLFGPPCFSDYSTSRGGHGVIGT